ncbi:MAG: nucleotidyl transferase AbiEii/AbiGii toxin family protein [Gammaproteobacteria bacterium]
MNDIINTRLKKYQALSPEQEEDALKEILQEIILNSLANTDFFNEAVFQGGTALRILYNLPRFSEDLDFILRKPNPNFKWEIYFSAIEKTCHQYGIFPEILDKSTQNSTVKKMFLKDNSIGKVLDISFKHHPGRKLLIKLEIDSNPPEGSKSETKFIDFPLIASIQAQTLPSNFSGKIHAILCRKYLKGRDFYDFIWYISNKVNPNFTFLNNAIRQTGPWANQNIEVSPDWCITELRKKIESINWVQARHDVEPFIKFREKKNLALWSTELFLDRLDKLKAIIC